MKPDWRHYLHLLSTKSKVVPVLLALLSLQACSGVDPIKDKERMIAQGGNTSPEGGGSKDREQIILYSFEHWGEIASGAGQLPALLDSLDQAPELSSWISPSNVGFGIIPGADLSIENVPLSPYEAGYKGKAIRLRSRKGFRFFGMGSWLVAGSLYTGTLERSLMVQDPTGATKYGIAWGATPQSLSLHYQYKAGANLIDGTKSPDTHLEGRDQASIVAVFYDITDDPTPLTGKTIGSDPRIVSQASAILSDTEGEAWEELQLPFMVMNRELFERIDHRERNYRLAIVLSSSHRGGAFIGAIDSELLVDELKVINKATKQ